ncbi:hypothetical protein E4T43_09313 [Aureobasidium subglaciale]|nr:hypothetical protein E4T43_09313 [Aureobasidium subglaciale]
MRVTVEVGTKREALFYFLLGDISASLISATLVTPFVSIIDRSIVEKAASKQPVIQGLKRHALSALRNPGTFLFSKSFGLVWILYAVTYSVANSADTLASSLSPEHAGSIVFASTLVVNVPLGVRKDMRFVQLFGAQHKIAASSSPTLAGVATLPSLGYSRAALASFLARDALTIFGSFTLAPRLATSIPDWIASTVQSRHTVSQLAVPAAVQFLATPFHMLGLDLAARRYQVPWNDRILHARVDLWASAISRAVRILPAFGFGCIVNGELREQIARRRLQQE